MNRTLFPTLTILFLILGSSLSGQTDQREIFRLTTYLYSSPEQETRLDRYLADAWIPAMHRAGIDRIGVFKPKEPGNEGRIYILVPFRSLDGFVKAEEQLLGDKVFTELGAPYLEASHDDPPYDRMESVLMRAFPGSPELRVPKLSSPRSERVYELRSYQAATEALYRRKVEMFDEGEAELFRELGFQPVFFGEVLSSNQMPHLMYMTVHEDAEAQEANWNAFRVHPDWERMKGMERYAHTVSHIDKYLLYPAAYSDY